MSSKLKIDINADVGEGVDNEASLMPFLSSCNVACGGHAGDLETMVKVVRLAKKYNVKIGAHPSFPDKENFGRINMNISSEKLSNSLKAQIADLISVLHSENLQLNHVKPHGALYNLAVHDEEIASVILNTIQSLSSDLKLYAPHKSVIAKMAKNRNITVVCEGFADRNYNGDLTLVSRQNPEALITKKEKVLEHVLRLVKDQCVRTLNGKKVDHFAETICIHGDTEHATEMLAYLYNGLNTKGVTIR